MADVDVVKLNDVEKKTFLRFGIFIVLVLAIYVHRYWFDWNHDYRAHDRADLLTAHDYVNNLPKSAAPTLFSSNLRSFGVYGQQEIAQRAISEFHKAQAASYPRFLLGRRITVLVQPGFLAASPNERLRFLAESGVHPKTADSLVQVQNDSTGCIAAKIENDGWTRRAYVLADPSALKGDPDIVSCIKAGLSFVNGLPIVGKTFDLSQMPSDSIAAVVLDYTMQCAFEGASDETPRQSDRGITSKPTIACIRDKIEAALRAAQP